MAKIPAADWLCPWFPFLRSEFFARGVFVLAFALLFAAIVNPRPWFLKLGIALSCWAALALQASLYWIGHSQVVWLFTLFCLSVPHSSSMNGVIVARVIAFSIYTNAGLWKLRGVVNALFASDYSFARTLPEHMAVKLMEGAKAYEPVLTFLFQHPRTSAVLWMVVTLSQISFILPIVKPRWNPLFAKLAILFHMAVYLILDVKFMTNILMLIWLFFVFKDEEPRMSRANSSGVANPNRKDRPLTI